MSIPDERPAKREAKPQTRILNGRLQSLSEPDAVFRRWEPAVRMDDCRRALIDQQQRLANRLGMSYRDPDPVGTGQDDETAFKVEHADWGSDRSHLPAICWRFLEDEKNNPRPSKNPGYMRYQGKIILDPNNDPIKDWPQLPLTLSSMTRGYRLEAMSRQNPHLEYRDFMARMPSVIEKTKIDDVTGGNVVVMEAPKPNSVCNMRRIRFREEKGLLSWNDKGKAETVGKGLEKLYGQRLINNSMQSFGRDLTKHEQDEVKKGDNARFPESRSAGPASQATTKESKHAGTIISTIQQTKAEAQRAPRQKRLREDNEDFDFSDDHNIGQAGAASSRKRRQNAGGQASIPTIVTTNLDKDRDASAMGRAQTITRVRSISTPRALTPPTREYNHEGNDNSKDKDKDYKEHETRPTRRHIRPMPARHDRGETRAVQHPASPELQEQEQEQEQDQGIHGDIDPQYVMTDDDEDDATTDIESSTSADAPVEEQVEEIVEKDKQEEDTPQETDLERHRRVTREFLGEEDDYYWLPYEKPPWESMQLFPQ